MSSNNNNNNNEENMIIKSGYLIKRGGLFKTWKKRKFDLLLSNELCYYDDKNVLKGVIHINKKSVIDIIEYDKFNKSHCFAITPNDNNNKRIYYIMASNYDERDEWISIIKTCIRNMNSYYYTYDQPNYMTYYNYSYGSAVVQDDTNDNNNNNNKENEQNEMDDKNSKKSNIEWKVSLVDSLIIGNENKQNFDLKKYIQEYFVPGVDIIRSLIYGLATQTAKTKHKNIILPTEMQKTPPDMHKSPADMRPDIVDPKFHSDVAALKPGTDERSAALMLAAENGHFDIVKYLAEHGGANINVQKKNGSSVLMRTVAKGYFGIVKFLTSRKANLNLTDNNGSTALMSAVVVNRMDMIKHLIMKGADIDIQNHVGLTALMSAVALDRVDIVNYLVLKGANINSTNNYGETARDIAVNSKKSNSAQIVEILDGSTLEIQSDASNADTNPEIKKEEKSKQNINDELKSKTLNFIKHINDLQKYMGKSVLNETIVLPNKSVILKFKWILESYQQYQRQISLNKQKNIDEDIFLKLKNMKFYLNLYNEYIRDCMQNVTKNIKVNKLKNKLQVIISHHEIVIDKIDRIITIADRVQENSTNADTNKKIKKRNKKKKRKQQNRKPTNKQQMNKNKSNIIKLEEVKLLTSTNETLIEERNEFLTKILNNEHNNDNTSDEFKMLINNRIEKSFDQRIVEKCNELNTEKDLISIKNAIRSVKDELITINQSIVDRLQILKLLYIEWNHMESYVAAFLIAQNLENSLDDLYEQYDKKLKQCSIEFDEKTSKKENEHKIVNIQLQFHEELCSYIPIVHQHRPEILNRRSKYNGNMKKFQQIVICQGLIPSGLSIKSFVNMKLLIESNISLFTASLNSKQYILKCYKTKNSEMVLDEAIKLKSLSHPYIVNIESLLLDMNECFDVYLQMPYFKYDGFMNLIKSRNSSPIDTNHIITLMKQIALAIIHLHNYNIIHCNIEPSNIYIKDEYNCYLSEYNLNQNLQQRIQNVSKPYITPEIFNNNNNNNNDDNNTKISMASDVYQFGLILFDLNYDDNDDDVIRPNKENNWTLKLDNNKDGVLDDLLKKILVINSGDRLKMSDVLEHEYFNKEYIDFYKRYETIKVKEEKRLRDEYDCKLCLHTYHEIDGVICTKKLHFLCNACFEKQVLEQNGLINCPQRFVKEDACICDPYSDNVILNHVESSVFDKYIHKRIELLKIDGGNESKIKELILIKNREDNIRQIVHYLNNNILVLRCRNPNGCNNKLMNFNGNCVITCDKCDTQFCAWCFKWCNKDAHEHVIACSNSMNYGSYYGTVEQFFTLHYDSYRHKVNQYISTLHTDIQNDVIQRIFGSLYLTNC